MPKDWQVYLQFPNLIGVGSSQFIQEDNLPHVQVKTYGRNEPMELTCLSVASKCYKQLEENKIWIQVVIARLSWGLINFHFVLL